MRATINDVAKEAGVSITTVSRVLNNNYPVKTETRIKVEEVIKKLKYKPNVMARGLITRKTSMIGVVVPGFTNLFFSTIVESIENCLKSSGYTILLCNTSGNPESEISIVEELVDRQLDGIIVIDPITENLNNNFYDKVSQEIPLIIVNGGIGNHKCSCVSYDEVEGTDEAFNYLLKLGHKRIALIRGNKSYSYDIKENLYKNIIKDNGLNYDKVIVVGNGNSIDVISNTQKSVEKLLLSKECPSAIFACNDIMAIGALNACTTIGLNVPRDVSIIGFDNTLLSEISNPKLTSVNLNMKQVGHKAAEELLSIIGSDFNVNNRKVIMSTNLVIRDSCSKII